MKSENVKIKQTRPFVAIIPKAFESGLIADAKKFGNHYGIFFSTSGKCLVERINPTAQYTYIFRTDKP